MRSKYNSVCGLLDVHGYRNRHGRPDYKRHGRVVIPPSMGRQTPMFQLHHRPLLNNGFSCRPASRFRRSARASATLMQALRFQSTRTRRRMRRPKRLRLRDRFFPAYLSLRARRNALAERRDPLRYLGAVKRVDQRTLRRNICSESMKLIRRSPSAARTRSASFSMNL